MIHIKRGAIRGNGGIAGRHYGGLLWVMLIFALACLLSCERTEAMKLIHEAIGTSHAANEHSKEEKPSKRGKKGHSAQDAAAAGSGQGDSETKHYAYTPIVIVIGLIAVLGLALIDNKGIFQTIESMLGRASVVDPSPATGGGVHSQEILETSTSSDESDDAGRVVAPLSLDGQIVLEIRVLQAGSVLPDSIPPMFRPIATRRARIETGASDASKGYLESPPAQEAVNHLPILKNLIRLAATTGDPNPLRHALISGLSAARIDTNGEGILHFAAINGTPEAIRCLVEIGGADVNARSHAGRTPLMVATELLVALVEAESDEVARVLKITETLQQLGGKH